MARKLITEVLTEAELKRLRAIPFVQRNKIIQDKLNMEMRRRVIELRKMEAKRKFIF